ncbi:MAG: hypothetical protein GMKNLPBB_00155 [Myxococcota bacterium]|nr:hypothetical protein [Myxococcota bacterium]
MGAFWGQKHTDYRNFQIMFGFQTLNFLIPGASYMFDPQGAIDNLSRFSTLLTGAGPYPYAAGETGVIWRVLASSNVLTLGLMCLLLQINVRRFFAVLWPLVFMKGSTSLAFLGFFLFDASHWPGWLLIFCWDGLATFIFLWFAPKARRAAVQAAPGELVPALRMEA